jgi:hypothetical protein
MPAFVPAFFCLIDPVQICHVYQECELIDLLMLAPVPVIS